MSKTKIKIAEVTIESCDEHSYNGIVFYVYKCSDCSTFTSKSRFNVGSKVNVFISKFQNFLTLVYSCNE